MVNRDGGYCALVVLYCKPLGTRIVEIVVDHGPSVLSTPKGFVVLLVVAT